MTGLSLKNLPVRSRTLVLLAVIASLLGMLLYVSLRSGPLAPVTVTVGTVESRALMPTLFGIGTVEARYTYKIGPTFAGRVEHLDVHVGERVEAGQVLGRMAPIDLDERIRAQASIIQRAEAALRETQARQAYAKTQARRYEKLFSVRSTSGEIVASKRLELELADAAVVSARSELARAHADHQGLLAQSDNLRLIAPVDGVVAVRNIDPGTTVLAGQSVIEIIDPGKLWINVRLDQSSASGLAAGLPAHIVLRSREGPALAGRVLHIDPRADAVTEETLAKVVFDVQPEPWPPLGELAEVSIDLAARAPSAAILNAALQREGGKVGVWRVIGGSPRFVQVQLGVSDLDGYVQVREGLSEGDQVVLYSERMLTARSRIRVVDHLPGVLQ